MRDKYWHPVDFFAGLVIVAAGMLIGWLLIQGCATLRDNPVASPSATTDVQTETETSIDGSVGGNVSTSSKTTTFNFAGSAGWLLALPVLLLWMRKRTAIILVERLSRSIELNSHNRNRNSVKKWIAVVGCGNRQKPDKAELLLRSILRSKC